MSTLTVGILSPREETECDRLFAEALSHANAQHETFGLTHLQLPEEQSRALELWLAGLSEDIEQGNTLPERTKQTLEVACASDEQTATAEGVPVQVLKREKAIAVASAVRAVSGQIGLRILQTTPDRNHGLAVAETLLEAGCVEKALEALELIDNLPLIAGDEGSALSFIAMKWKEQDRGTFELRVIISQLKHARSEGTLEKWFRGFQESFESHC